MITLDVTGAPDSHKGTIFFFLLGLDCQRGRRLP